MVMFLLGFVLGGAVVAGAVGIVAVAVDAAYRSQDFDR